MIGWLFQSAKLSNVGLLLCMLFLILAYSYIVVKEKHVILRNLKLLCKKVQKNHDYSINQKGNSRYTIGHTEHINKNNSNNDTRGNPRKNDSQFTLTNQKDIYKNEN